MATALPAATTPTASAWTSTSAPTPPPGTGAMASSASKRQKVAQHVYGFFSAECRAAASSALSHRTTISKTPSTTSIRASMFTTIRRAGTRITSISTSALPVAAVRPRKSGRRFQPGRCRRRPRLHRLAPSLNRTLTQSNFTQWRANFGKSITGRVITSAAAPLQAAGVPEPGSGVLLFTIAYLIRFRRRTRRFSGQLPPTHSALTAPGSASLAV